MQMEIPSIVAQLVSPISQIHPIAQPSSNNTSSEADALIQRGILLHEAMQLDQSTSCFGHAAKLGSPLGMYLYGLALKSGWGCIAEPNRAFKLFSKAADLLLSSTCGIASKCLADVPQTRSMVEISLGMLLYELSYCYKEGHGTAKCKSNSHFYLQVAAHFGDPHAQMDLGTNYLYGLGVKSNKNLAAKYFRLASTGGMEIPGNTWIWKTKYDFPKSSNE